MSHSLISVCTSLAENKSIDSLGKDQKEFGVMLSIGSQYQVLRSCEQKWFVKRLLVFENSDPQIPSWELKVSRKVVTANVSSLTAVPSASLLPHPHLVLLDSCPNIKVALLLHLPSVLPVPLLCPCGCSCLDRACFQLLSCLLDFRVRLIVYLVCSVPLTTSLPTY